MIMTPLPLNPDLDRLAIVLRHWLNTFKHWQTPSGIGFCFAVADETEELALMMLRPLRRRFQVSTVPVPHRRLTELYPELAQEWARSRFLEIALYRNMLLDEARRVRPDMAVFLDMDVVPPKDFVKCFAEDGRDVCAGVVKTFNNNWDEVLSFGTFDEPFFTDLHWARQVPKESLTKVDFANTACMALGRRVLADEQARFESLWVDYKGEKLLLSEDHAFCRLLTELGYAVYLDSRIRCGHLRETPRGRRWLWP